MKILWILIKRWWYTGIFLVLLVPNVSHAEYVHYYMYDDETVEEVAKKFNVPVSKVIIDYEGSVGGNWRQIVIDTSPVVVPEKVKPSTAVKTQVATTTDASDLKVKVAVLEAENVQLKKKVALLEQIIALLKTIVGLKR